VVAHASSAAISGWLRSHLPQRWDRRGFGRVFIKIFEEQCASVSRRREAARSTVRAVAVPRTPCSAHAEFLDLVPQRRARHVQPLLHQPARLPLATNEDANANTSSTAKSLEYRPPRGMRVGSVGSHPHSQRYFLRTDF
jgi:hypothetical protein